MDASPFGLGGTLSTHGTIVAYFGDPLHEEDFTLFGSSRGDPAYQSEYELLAVLVALKAFANLLAQAGICRVVLRCDNTAVLHTAFSYKSHSPLMAQLTAELCLELEDQQLQHLVPQHVPGLLNVLADRLSRLHEYSIPAELQHVHRVEVPRRTSAYYRAWPQTAPKHAWENVLGRLGDGSGWLSGPSLVGGWERGP